MFCKGVRDCKLQQKKEEEESMKKNPKTTIEPYFFEITGNGVPRTMEKHRSKVGRVGDQREGSIREKN